jgi:hypothetical protein
VRCLVGGTVVGRRAACECTHSAVNVRCGEKLAPTSAQNVRRVSQTRRRSLPLLRCGRENRPAVRLEADLQDREAAAGHRPHEHAGKGAPAEKREFAPRSRKVNSNLLRSQRAERAER